MLRKSARVLILLAAVELGLLALLVVRFGLSPILVICLVVGATALGMLLSLRQIGRLFSGGRRSTKGSPTPGHASSFEAGIGADPAGSASSALSTISDGAMRSVAGLLLAFPGLLTSLAGLILLLPPVRSALKPIVWSQFARLLPAEVRTAGQGFGGAAAFEDLFGQSSGTNPFGRGRNGGRPDRSNVVDVDVASTDPDSSGNPSSAPPELR